MSVYLKLATSGVGELLRWVRLPGSGYAWNKEKDRFCIDKKAEPVAVFAHLSGLDVKDFERSLALGMVKAEQVEEHQWQAACKRGKVRDLPTLLRMIRLEKRDRPPRSCDLLVVTYGGDMATWRDLFAAAPKPPDAYCRVARLKEESGAVRFLFTIPEASQDHRWANWLRSRRSEHPEAGVSLFYLQPGGENAEFWIQYGYAHPLPDIVQLYPSPRSAREFLIRGDGRRRRWTALGFRDGEEEFLLQHPPLGIFDFNLGDDGLVHEQLAAHPGTAAADVGTLQFRWTPELLPLGEGRAGRLSALGAKIQTTRESLVRMEGERHLLHGRRWDRYRFVLRFRQPPDSTELPSRFRRFLALSLRDLDGFRYLHEVGGAQDGHHLILTTGPMHYQDLHTAFADEVYVQPHHWGDWGLTVFLREGFEIRPAIDQDKLADRLQKAFIPTETGQSAPTILLDPPDGDEAPFRARSVRFPEGGNASDLLRFLSTQFPPAAVATIDRANDELRDQLEKRKQKLEKEIENTELGLMSEAEKRLQAAQEVWNALAPQIEALLRCADLVRDHHKILEDHLRVHGGRWEGLMDTMVAVNGELVRSLLAALANLTVRDQEWTEAIKATEPANVDVRRLLEQLRERLDKLLRSAWGVARDTRMLYLKLAPVLAAKQVMVEKAIGQAVHNVRRGKARDRVLKARILLLEKLLGQIEDLLARLSAARDHVKALVDRASKGIASAQAVNEELPTLLDTLLRTIEDWEEALDDALTREAELEKDVEAAKLRVAELRKRHKASCRKSRGMVKALTLRKERVTEAVDHLEKQVEAIELLESDLESLENRREELESVTYWRSGDLRETADRISAGMAGIPDGCHARLDELRRQMRDLAGDLEVLAEAERSVASLGGRPQLVADAAALAKGFRDLEERDWKRIWQQ